MRSVLSLILSLLICTLNIGARSHLPVALAKKNDEIIFLELKLKKELSDKKLVPQKKYTLAILAAREFKQLHNLEKSLDFYQIAKETKVEENKIEITQAFSKKKSSSIENTSKSVFFYETNLKYLLTNKKYEKAILCLNPDKLIEPSNEQYRIIYDLLNVKIRKRAVKKLFCFEDNQKNPDAYQYSNLLCDLLIDYLRDGKLGSDHYKVVEEYFLKHD
ncbi:MAG: hypothetical protein Q7U04_08005, partial [Bacteriovorax sp.]|nr:hypothetical protein [Bacteriovorax sp.]